MALGETEDQLTTYPKYSHGTILYKLDFFDNYFLRAATRP